MNTPHTPVPGRAKQHPLLILAAIAVILFCLVGTAAIMGWIPSSISGNNRTGDLNEADRLALATKLQAESERPIAAPLAVLPAAEREPVPAALAARPRAPVQSLQPVEPEYRPARAPVEPEYRQVRAPEQRPAPKPVQLADATPAKRWCSNCGNVESIREITTRAQGSGLGAAGGAVLGGLLGNQIGGGSGRQIATVAGAVGGAVVGNQVEGHMKATRSYEIKVRLDDGGARTFRQQSAPNWRTGDRVRIVKGALRPVR